MPLWGVPSGLIMDSPLIDAYLLTYIVTSSGTGYSQPAPFRRAVRARRGDYVDAERALPPGWMDGRDRTRTALDQGLDPSALQLAVVLVSTPTDGPELAPPAQPSAYVVR